jgi:hypothetical protein
MERGLVLMALACAEIGMTRRYDNHAERQATKWMGPDLRGETDMAEGTISDAELAELVRRTGEATSALMRGDMDRYLALTPHARGFTLMNPFGGPPARYEDRSESLRAAASYFKAGEAKLEVTDAHVWGDTVVLVMIERQHGEVGGLPDQDSASRSRRGDTPGSPETAREPARSGR